MNGRLFSALTTAMVIAVAALLVALPRIARRGLLFGVYVGKDTSDGDAARRLKRRWTWALLGWTVAALAAQWVVTVWRGPVGAYVAALAVLLVGYYVEYVRSHRAARALVAVAPPPVAAAYLTTRPGPRPLLAYVALVFAVVAGLLAVGHTFWHLGDLPARLPVHFDAAGHPDDYRPRSFSSVWTLPLMTLVMGTMLSIVALLTARAKRAVRQGDGGVSLAAQERFRATSSGIVAVVAILTTSLLATMSIGGVRVAIGQAEGLPAVGHIIAVLMIAVPVGGVGLMALLLGQGGARLEASADAAPLTNGLADNDRWVLGMFYVAREDPSIFVERRFGLGYTLNFGNWRAVALLVLFVGLLLGLSFGPRLFD